MVITAYEPQPNVFLLVSKSCTLILLTPIFMPMSFLSHLKVIRQCLRSAQRFEIRDQVGALGVVLQAGVDHRGVRYHRARIGEVFVQGGGIPRDAEFLVVGGVVEAWNAAGRATDHAEQRRTDAVLTRRHGVADAALRLVYLLAGGGIGGERCRGGSGGQEGGKPRWPPAT